MVNGIYPFHRHIYTLVSNSHVAHEEKNKSESDFHLVVNQNFKSSSLKGCEFQADLLDVTFLDSLFVQVFYELLALHPVDERADIAAVAEKCPAGQVQSISCRDRRQMACCKWLPACSNGFRRTAKNLSLTITGEK